MYDEYDNDCEGLYLSINLVLWNVFSDNNYVFVILGVYVMVLIQIIDCIYVFYYYVCNCYGMFYFNNMFVVMKFVDICSLEEYLYFVFFELNIELFEVVLVEFYKYNVDFDVINVNKVDNYLYCFCNYFYFYFFIELFFLFDFL